MGFSFLYLSILNFFLLKTIIVSVTNDLVTDQRVAKICNTLYQASYTIILVGRSLPSSKKITRTYKTKRLKLLFNKGFLFYAEYNLRLFFFLLFTKKDIVLSNDLDTLLPNFLISRLQNKKLIYDSHELFSEIPELINRPLTKKVWILLERLLIPHLKNCYTVSQSIADFYQKKYRTSFKVVRNVPKRKQQEKGTFPIEVNDKKIILYQGAVNIGRGLLLMIETLPLLTNHIFIIIGTGDIISPLKEKVTQMKLQNRIFFLGKLPPNELQKLTPLADIGISLEEDLGLNYKFALPNKIFDYLEAEVPVITSDLPEMKKLIQAFQVGEILFKRTPEELAKKIREIHTKSYITNIKKAKKTLHWDKEKLVLIQLFQNLM